MISGRLKIFGGLAIAAALGACSGNEGPQQPPMLADGQCSQLRADLNAMDKRGVPGMIDARNNGKKYGAAQDAEINRYNQVLDQYLGGQCASEQRYKQKMGIATPGSGRQAATGGSSDVTTGSIPKTQVKRRKPMSEEEAAAAAVDMSPGNYTGDDSKPRRKTASTSSTGAKSAKPAAPKATTASGDAATPAPTPAAVKAESGLPAAPAPAKSDDGDKKE